MFEQQRRRQLLFMVHEIESKKYIAIADACSNNVRHSKWVDFVVFRILLYDDDCWDWHPFGIAVVFVVVPLSTSERLTTAFRVPERTGPWSQH